MGAVGTAEATPAQAEGGSGEASRASCAGSVRDEHDAGEPQAVRADDGSWILPGLLRPDEIRRGLGLRVPEDDDYETLGGLIGDRLARIPAVGDSVELQVDDEEGTPQDVVLTVLTMDDLRVESVRLVRR